MLAGIDEEERQVALKERQEMQEGDEDKDGVLIIFQYREDMDLCLDSFCFVKPHCVQRDI